MRMCKILPILMYVAAASAVQATTLYYSSSAGAEADLYSIDTATGAQKLEMTLPGVSLSGLTSSPVPGAMYAMQVVTTSLSFNYECLHLIEPRHLGGRQRGAQKGRIARPGEQREAPLHLALAGLRQVLQQRLVAQHGVDRVGEQVAIARAELALAAKEVRHHRVGRVLEPEHLVQQFGGEFQQRVRMHRSIIRAPRPPRAARRGHPRPPCCTASSPSCACARA